MVSKEYQEAKDEVEALAEDFYRRYHHQYDGTPEGLQRLKDLWSEIWPEDNVLDEYVMKGVLSPDDADEIERDVFHTIFRRIKGEEMDSDVPKYYEPTKKHKVEPYSPYMPGQKTPRERKKELEEAWHLLHGLRNLARTLVRKGFNKEAKQVFALFKFAAKCPYCQSEGAYLGGGPHDIECVNPQCTAYSKSWREQSGIPEQSPLATHLAAEVISQLLDQVHANKQLGTPMTLEEAYDDFRDGGAWNDFIGNHPSNPSIDDITGAQEIVEDKLEKKEYDRYT